MKDYTVKSETAVFSDTMKITETTDSNHASNINAGPMCAFENTIANRRDITKIQNAKAQLAFDESEGGLKMSDNVINIPRESTMKALMEMQKMAVAGGANPGAADLCYKYMVAQCTSKEQVDNLFIEWWKSQYDASKFTKVEMLERWFGRVLEDDRVHGVSFPLFATSSTAIGELTDDSVGLKCVPSTAKTQGQDDFAHLPQFWCLEVSAEKKTDGSHEIFYVEHIDDIKDVRSGEHLCWVLQKNTYTKEWDEDGYRYLKMKCHQSTGYELWPEGRDRTGRVYAYAARPKYYAGIGASGKITCGTGLAPVNWTSHTAGVTKWRDRGTQYSGAERRSSSLTV